jgi:PAS domain S-box-containing protein
MWEFNPHSGELHWTDEIFPMLGYAKEELSPSFTALENRVHPDDLEHFHTTLQASIDERREYSVEYRVVLPGNLVKWIAVHGDVVLDDKGEVINMYGAVMDIHEQKQRELKLARLTRVLRSIRDVNQLITHVKQATVLVDSTVDILTDNGGFSCVHFDLVDEDLNVLHHASSMTEDWGEMEEPICACSQNKGDQLPLDTTAATATARIKHLSNPRGGEIMQLCRTIGHEAEIYGRLCVGTRPEIIPLEEEEALFNEICDDLGYALYNIQLEHRREEAYAQMQLAKDEAEKASHAKDAFLAVMNHELRTPLNPIMAYTQLLMEEANEEDTSLLKGILDASRRMLGLIEMILEFSNLNNAHTAPRKEPFNLLQACNAVFDEFRLQAGKLDYRFNNGGHGLSPLPIGLQVDGDRDMLMRILENILQNAVKYTPKGSITFIAGRYPDSRKPPHFHFVVKDTGIGIDDTSVERLFDAFQQADNSYKRSYGGLGLGLAICKKLVDLLGGNIHVESSLHQGSTFTVELPLSLSKEGGDGIPEKDASSGNLAFSKELKILIVEDEENNAAVTGTLIRHLGGQPTLAEGGLKALDLCRNNRYDAIFLDLRMPGVDGIETFKRLRDESALNALTPVVALTANVSDPMRDHCERLGMAGFVAKPISLETLYSTVQELI